MLEGMKTRPGMYLISNTLAEAIGRLGERLFRSPLHDWLREWLAHSFGLDCECAWEGMALHLVSGARARRKKIQWSPELTLEVVEMLPGRKALGRIGSSEQAQLAAIRDLCDLILTFLKWEERLTPAHRRRFRRKFLRPFRT